MYLKITQKFTKNKTEQRIEFCNEHRVSELLKT